MTGIVTASMIEAIIAGSDIRPTPPAVPPGSAALKPRIFRAWRGRLADLFVAGGVERSAAVRLATTLVAASEGAVVVSRAERSLEAFELVAEELLAITP